MKPVISACLLLACTIQAFATDSFDPSSRQLTAASVAIGQATFTNMVVSVGHIVSGPGGSSPVGSGDRYDPASKELIVPAVQVGTRTYYNVVATVSGLVASGSASGTDVYDGATLSIPYVRVGNTVYTHVSVEVDSIQSPGGGMPKLPWDTYDVSSRQLTLAAVQFGGKVYTNAIVTVSKVLAGGATGFSGYALLAGSVGSGGASLVSQFEVGTNGQLLAATPATTVIPNSSPFSMTADSTGHYAYLNNSADGRIYQLAIGVDGTLACRSARRSSRPRARHLYLVANPAGPYLYAAAAGRPCISSRSAPMARCRRWLCRMPGASIRCPPFPSIPRASFCSSAARIFRNPSST